MNDLDPERYEVQDQAVGVEADADPDLLETLSEERIEDDEREVPCEFLTGRAGTGKTYQTMLLHAKDSSYALLTATTGIAAVNLGAGVTTVHSALKYSDTDSLRDVYLSGQVTRILHNIALNKRRLLVEEASMIDARQLDIWYKAVREVNQYRDVAFPFGLTLVGDFGQLPPVKAPWAFYADCWPKFAERTTRLTKVWRQDQGPFLDALNAARVGNGGLSAEILTSMGVRWYTATDQDYDGTTILPKNQGVNRYNDMALDRVQGLRRCTTSRRWGKQRSEWGQNPRTHEWGIPPRFEFKIGAYVMILSNAPDFSYVNGDCGHIKEYAGGALSIELKRNGVVVEVDNIVRSVEQYDKPEGFTGERIPAREDYNDYIPRSHYRAKTRKYVLGQIEYMPVKLAYASTVHKSQGLTLDACQIDFRDHFFSSEAMLYVALSRCRTAAGLRLVGMREVFAKHCNANTLVREWL